jgi:hypothetical protein
MWFASVVSCDTSVQRVCGCDHDGPVSVCASVVMLPVQTASIRRRLRTRDRGKRSSAQTVSLRPKQCRAEPLAFEGPSAGGWDGYSQQIRYAIASARSYHISPAPGCPW